MVQPSRADLKQFFDALEEQLDQSYERFLKEMENLKEQIGQTQDQELVEKIDNQYQWFKGETERIETNLMEKVEEIQEEKDQQKADEIREKIKRMAEEGRAQKQEMLNNTPVI